MIQISIMLILYLIFLTSVNILANPIPTDSDNLDIATSSINSLDDPVLLSDSDTSNHVGCTEDTSSISGSDGNLQGGNIVRRGSRICPADSFTENKPLILAPAAGVAPKGPKVQTGPSTESVDTPSRVKYSVSPCRNTAKNQFLSCSSPEVWYSGILERVLNCVEGKSRPYQHWIRD